MSKRNKPNILLVVLDTARADHLSCYGYARPTTPHIDRIAAEGCRFDAAMTAAPFSPAAYASLFSNLFPHQHGVNGDDVRVWPDHWPRLPEILQKQGYFTFCVSNNDFVSEATNAARGFDVFRGPQIPWLTRQHSRIYHRMARHVGQRAADAVDSARILAMAKGDSIASARRAAALAAEAQGRPFFGVLLLMDPHALYQPARTRFVRDRAAARSFLRRINGRQMWAKVMAGAKTMTPAECDAAIDFYDAEIHHADRAVGVLYDALGRAGVRDDTLLALCADHGESFGEHGVWGHGFSLTDEQTRVPLVMRWPRAFSAGSSCAGVVQLHDVHETFLDAAQDRQGRRPHFGRLESRSHTDRLEDRLHGARGEAECHENGTAGGTDAENFPRSLLGAGEAGFAGREAAFSEFPVQHGTLALMSKFAPGRDWGKWGRPMWSVRTREWRYIEYGDARCEPVECELLDVLRDPGQRDTVHEKYADVCREMSSRLAEHRAGTDSDRRASGEAEAPLDEAVLDRLRALGYME